MKQLDLLKAQASLGGAGGTAGALADRVAELQKKAALLANTTDTMLKTLEGTSQTNCYRGTEGFVGKHIQKSSKPV